MEVLPGTGWLPPDLQHHAIDWVAGAYTRPLFSST